MIILFIFVFFFNIKTEELANIREGLNSNDNSIFIKSVEKLLKIPKEELPDDFKKTIILKAIEKFDEELMPLRKKNILLEILKVFEHFIGEPKRNYRRSILNLFIYVSNFSNSGYEEELLNRLVTRNLIIANSNNIIKIIKKREKEVNSNENLLYSVCLLLELSSKGAISIENEEKDYLKNVFKNVYENFEEKERCRNFSHYISFVKEEFFSDEKIIKDVSICICKEKEFSDVITYYFGLLEQKIKGADKLINACLENIKDEKLKAIFKRLIDEYLQGIPFKITKDDFSYISVNSNFRNPCCE